MYLKEINIIIQAVELGVVCYAVPLYLVLMGNIFKTKENLEMGGEGTNK